MDPYERADITSDQYYDWIGHNAFLIAEAQMRASQFLMTFVDWPPSQMPASFGVDQVRKQVDESIEEHMKRQGVNH
ncbi:MAG: hypothetical protein JO210_15310 [Acidobacteriaceae bacterium]|nr:hypothetical protein [Acidobacteriaceae bacterium]